MAAGLCVDKSLVGRWASGAVVPSDHNLARISEFVARRVPGFVMADWDREPAEFAALLGIDHFDAAQGDPDIAGFQLVPPEFLLASRAMTARRGAAYEGFWRTIRPSIIMDGKLFRDHGMIRIEPNGFLSVRMASSGLVFEGWAMLAEGLLFVVVYSRDGGTPFFLMFRGVPLPKAELLDGLLLMSALNSERTPSSVPILLERIGDLSGDREADDRHCESLFDGESVVDETSVPAEILGHLKRDIGPKAAAAGGDLFLVSASAANLTRGSTAIGKLRG